MAYATLKKRVTPANQNPRPYSEAQAWFVWSFAALFYMYQIILRISPGVMADDLMGEFGVEACALGGLAACYLMTYATLQIPAGLGLDKFGPTRLLRYAVPVCVLGTLIFSLSNSFYLACFGRLLIGVGATCGFLGTLKLGSLWFTPQRFALVVGMTMVAGTVGATFGQAPLAYLIGILGWREALLYVVAPIGMILSAGIWLFVRDTPPAGPRSPIQPADTSLSTLFEQLKTIALNYRIWLIGFYGALMYAPILVFVDLWGVSFLTKVYGIDKATAGSMTTMYYIGIGIGSPLVATIADSIERYKAPMIISAILSIACMSVAIYVGHIPLPVMYALLLMAGIVFSAQPLIFAAVCPLTPQASHGTVISFTNMVVMGMGLILQFLVGWLLEQTWAGEICNAIPHYSIEEYRYALLSIPVGLFIALVIALFIPETFPRTTKKK